MITPNVSLLGLKTIDLTTDDAVSSGGGTDTLTLRPDDGLIYNVVNIDMNIPAIGGATGNHAMDIDFYDGTNLQDIAQVSGTDGATFSIGGKYGFAGDSEYPSGINEQYDIIHRIIWSSYDSYIRFNYTNNSDTNQTGTRVLRIIVLVYKEVL